MSSLSPASRRRELSRKWSSRLVEPAELQRDRAEVEQRARDVRRVAAGTEEREALLEQRLGALVVADRQGVVAEVVEREGRFRSSPTSRASATASSSSSSARSRVARGEHDRTEVAERVGDEPFFAGLAGDVEALLGEARSRRVVALQQRERRRRRQRASAQVRVGAVAALRERLLEPPPRLVR